MLVLSATHASSVDNSSQAQATAMHELHLVFLGLDNRLSMIKDEMEVLFVFILLLVVGLPPKMVSCPSDAIVHESRSFLHEIPWQKYA